jgi:hypothetical protein
MRRVVEISASRSGNRRASGDSFLLDLVKLLDLVDLLDFVDLLALRAAFFADVAGFLDDFDRAEALGIRSGVRFVEY